MDVESKKLSFEWPRESLRGDAHVHASCWDLDWLMRESYNPPHPRPFHKSHLEDVRLWDSDIMHSNVGKDIEYSDILATSTGMRRALDQLKQYGICFVKNVPSDATEGLVTRFGEIRHTFYGRLWDVENVVDAKNVAYTSLYLGLHMDLMYFEAPPGLQFLHSIHNTVSGGQSIFSDSFKAVDYFKALHPVEYELLCTQPIAFQYRNASHNMHYLHPTIDTTNLNEPLRVHYSPPFQGPIPFSPTIDQDAFFRAFSLWEEVIRMDGMVFERRLEGGVTVIFNNRRVLHGRRAFEGASGRRLFKGSYVDWDCFKDLERGMVGK